MGVVIFEDEGSSRFSPLNLLRHTSQLRWGTKTLMESLSESTEGVEVELWGREGLKDVTKAATNKAYNEPHDSTVLLVNGRARPGSGLWDLTSKKTAFVASAKGGVVAARVKAGKTEPGVLTPRALSSLSKENERLEAPEDLLFRGYWDLVESNGLAIAGQAGRFSDALALPATAKLRGPPSNLRIHGSAEVEDHVAFDTRLGPVVVSEGATIESFSKVSGPCYVGPKSRILSGLLRGGTSVFEGCKVGGEVDNSVIMPFTNKAHFGFVGDSYVGEWVNLGAGSTFSNLKNTYGNVRSAAGGSKVDTGMLKLGPALGDMSKVSIGATIFAGKSVGAGSHVTGIASSDVPDFTYFDGVRGKMVELLLSSVLETQRRMKERRGLSLSRAEEELIAAAFRATSSSRRSAGVRRGRIA